MTFKDFISLYKGKPNEQAAILCYVNIKKSLMDSGIFSDLTLIGALATVRVEVGRSFLPVVENPIFAVRYEFRKDLGNLKLGEGVKYRGRGYIQLTGRSNYGYYGNLLNIDLLNKPELAADPVIAAKILALFFKTKGINVCCDKKIWVTVRRIVNGGYNGLALFLDIVSQYLKVAESNINVNNNKNMTKFIKFFTTGSPEVQTLNMTPGDNGQRNYQDNGQTHQFTDAADAVARSTSESFIFWDDVAVGPGSLAE